LSPNTALSLLENCALVIENLRGFDIGLGTLINFGPS